MPHKCGAFGVPKWSGVLNLSNGYSPTGVPKGSSCSGKTIGRVHVGRNYTTPG